MGILKGKQLYLHFDIKLVKQMEEDLIITVSVKRIAISATPLDISDINDILLDDVQAESLKRSFQAHTILNLLECHEFVDQAFATC